MRTEQEAHICDIMAALGKLEKVNKVPVIAVEATNLGVIPRSHPEELNNISLVDRLNRLEQKIANVLEILDHTVAENMLIKEKLEQKTMNYAAAVKHGSPTAANNGPKVMSPSHEGIHVETADINAGAAASAIEKSFDLPKPPAPQPVARRGTFQGRGHNRGRSRGRFPSGRGRGLGRGSGHGYSGSMQSLSSAVSFNSRVSPSRERSNERVHDTSSDSLGFQVPGYERKKQQRRSKQRQNFITGFASSLAGKFKGAPEPSRDIFIFRVDPDTGVEDLRLHLRDMDVSVRALNQVSNPSAAYKSFRLTVPKSDFDILFDPSLWPEGVRVRRYFPRKDRGDSTTGDS